MNASFHMLAVLAALSVGCARRSLEFDGAAPLAPSADACHQAIAHLTIVPLTSQVDVGDGRGFCVGLRTIATFESGVTARVPSSWSLSLPHVGSVEPDGWFCATGDAGGDLRIAADFRGTRATAVMSLRVVHTVLDGVSPDEISLFDPARPRDREAAPPRFLTPENGTLYRYDESAELRWDPAGHRSFHVHFLNATSTVHVYTRAHRLQLGEPLRTWLAESSRAPDEPSGLRTIRVFLEAADSASDRVHETSEDFRLTLCPGADLCDGLDEDCNGIVDDGCWEPEWVAPSPLACR